MDNDSRKTQNNSQMYCAIMNSLAEECSNKLINLPSEYTIGIGTARFISVILLHKALMQKAMVDTRSTSSNFRTNLSSLDTYMPTVNSDIEKFNLYVSTCINESIARGETSEDLLDNLFKGYKVACDKTFVKYIEQKETDYFDGVDITPDSLMMRTENKYAALVERGSWGGMSEEQKQIIALTSTVTSLKNSMKLKKTPKKPKKSNNSENKNGKEEKRKKKKKNNNKEWAWKAVQPKIGEPKTKKVKGMQYHWCPFHESWTIHTANQCNKNPDKVRDNAPTSNPKADGNNVSFSASVSNIMDQLEEDM